MKRNDTSTTRTQINSKIGFNTQFMIAYWAKYWCHVQLVSARRFIRPVHRSKQFVTNTYKTSCHLIC